MKILLADEHLLYLEGLCNLLADQPDFDIVGKTKSMSETIEKSRELTPDLILMDFNLSDGSGLEATQTILAEQPGINIVFLTLQDWDERISEAVRLGAAGYLLKNLPFSEIIAFLSTISTGSFKRAKEMITTTDIQK